MLWWVHFPVGVTALSSEKSFLSGCRERSNPRSRYRVISRPGHTFPLPAAQDDVLGHRERGGSRTLSRTGRSSNSFLDLSNLGLCPVTGETQMVLGAPHVAPKSAESDKPENPVKHFFADSTNILHSVTGPCSRSTRISVVPTSGQVTERGTGSLGSSPSP